MRRKQIMAAKTAALEAARKPPEAPKPVEPKRKRRPRKQQETMQ